MKFDFKESRIISNGNTILKVIISPNATAARRDERTAVGWAWTGRNRILDEALDRSVVVSMSSCHAAGRGSIPGPGKFHY